MKSPSISVMAATFFCSSGDDQWKPMQNSDGTYTFCNLHSGLALEIPGAERPAERPCEGPAANGSSIAGNFPPVSI
ncbi:MAG: RICIN domain-containing protein [Verrucomicrobiota bacterium]|nr:RICIN domain-containing protein [Verrucomicrobiota bacterium]